MYMITFVTLVVALLGTYVQIYTKQISTAAAHQIGAADAMLAWHTNAVALATQLVHSASVPSRLAGGCSMTNTSVTNQPSLPPCYYSAAAGTNVYVSMTQPAGIPACNGGTTAGAQCWTALPPGYSSTYVFYSVFFQYVATSTTYWVLTYVPPPPAGGDAYSLGLLCLPGVVTGTATSCPGTQLSMTFNALYSQLSKDPRISPIAYGTATGTDSLGNPALTTHPLSYVTSPAPLTYGIPPTSYVPANSIGIITEVPACTSC